MQSKRKIAVLQTMGIEVFHARAHHDTAVSLHCLHLKKSNQSIWMIAEYDSSRAEQEQELLVKIAKALGVVAEPQVELSHNIVSLLHENSVIILMGENLAEAFVEPLPKATIISTYSPAQLLDDPVKKQHTWHAIKHLA
jgi:hypothetical protein